MVLRGHADQTDGVIPEQQREHVIDHVEISAGRGGLRLHCRDCEARLVLQLGEAGFDARVRSFLREHPGACAPDTIDLAGSRHSIGA